MFDLGANISAVPQAVLAIALVFAIRRNPTRPVILAALISYSAFYFAHTYIMTVAGLSEVLRGTEASPITGTVAGLLVIGFSVVKFCQGRAGDSRREIGGARFLLLATQVLLGCTFLSFIAAQTAYWGKWQTLNVLALKIGVISTTAWIVAIQIARTIAAETGQCASNPLQAFRFVVPVTIILLVVTLCAAVAEVSYGLSFYSDRTIFFDGPVFRSGAFLMNPNVWAVWAAVVGVVSAFLYHSKQMRLGLLIAISGLIAACFALSGARSVFYAYLFTLFVAASLLRLKASLRCQWFVCLAPALLLAGWMHVLATADGILFTDLNVRDNLTASVHWNASRIESAPRELLQYVLYRMDLADSFPTLFTETAPTRATMLSIEGRIAIPDFARAGEGSYIGMDNTFLPMLDVAGASGFISWCVLWLSVIILGARLAISRGTVAGIYGWAGIGGFTLIGMSMRVTQLFPIWALFSFAAGLALSALAASEHLGGSDELLG